MTPQQTEQHSEHTRTDSDVDAVARAFVRRFGTNAVDVDFGDDDESMRLHEIIPRVRDSATEHTRWRSALEALHKKHDLSFEEFDAIESGLLKLEQGGVPGVELVNGAPVEVHRQFDIETDDLVVTWRVACRETGATH